ncbi:PAS domain-containing sensor histidine kinase [Telmatospirillum sp. J64-1]|uniref:sensor histidine kinase n=1 Tax=Telmatospirillum sp. J64-1 TaxID=2502183 RepID=UPI001C8F8A15|nr:ATP-binding protein [Telmatospirillum sp. J64-1]
MGEYDSKTAAPDTCFLYLRSPAALLCLDENGCVGNINDTAARLLGCDREEAQGRPLANYLAPSSARFFRACVLPQLAQAGQGEASCLELGDGSGRSVSFSGHWEADPASGRRFCLAMLADVTARHRAEAAAALAHARLRDAVGGLPFGFCLWDSEDRLLLANDETLHIFERIGYELAPGQSFATLFRDFISCGLMVSPPSLEEVQEARRNLVAGTLRRHEVKFTDGRTILILDWRSSEGGIASLYQDITAETTMRAQLRAARRRAERADLSKTRFLAAAAHDLRQPLQGLSLYLHVLSSRLGDDQAELMGKVEACSASLHEMLDGLLDMTKLEAGLMQPEVTRVSAQAVARRVAEGLREQAGRKGLELRLHVPALEVESDPRMLERILMNLASNAVRYTKAGGVLIAGRRRGDRLRLEVWDTGMGLPSDRLKVISREFHRPETAGAERGSGLGLTIVQRLSHLLGHSLDVASRPDRGSVFSVEVPLAVKLPCRERVPAIAAS